MAGIVPTQPPTKKVKLSMDSYKDSTIKIIVGTTRNQHEFVVSKSFLCQKSGFFKAACNKSWASGQEGVIRLEEEKPKIFAMFLAWLTTGDIENSEDLIDVSHIPKQDNLPQQFGFRFNQLVSCCVLGDFLQAYDFYNSAMDLLVKTCDLASVEYESCLGAGSWQSSHVYKNTKTGSPLRLLVLDISVQVDPEILAASKFYDETVVNFENSAGREYLMEFLQHAVKVAQGKSVKMGWLDGGCKYHCHPGKPANYSCME